VALSSVEFREFVLAEKLEQVDYGLVLLDCAPSVDLMHTAALIAADLLIVPTRLDQLSLKGIRDVLESLTFLQKKNLTSCQLAGIIPTFYDRVTKESYQQLRHLAATFKQKVLPPIPLDTQCREATRFGKTLWEYAPNTRALMGFANGNGRSIGGYIQVMDRIQEML
jgi:chromosome partitioning protein